MTIMEVVIAMMMMRATVGQRCPLAGLFRSSPAPFLRPARIQERCSKRKSRAARRLRVTEDEGPQLEKLDLSSTGGLGGTSEDVYGPLAVLLLGFSFPEYHTFQEMLNSMNADMINLIPCPPSKMEAPLEEVIHLEGVAFKEGPLGLRRTVILSGMYASEVQEVIAAYRETTLPPAVFAAFVPKNAEKRICDLVEEVYDDHEYMIMKRNQSKGNNHT